MNAGAREQVFGDALACEEVRPATFLPGPMTPATVRTACAKGENLLRSLALVEDSRGEETDEHGIHELSMHRIEAKIDLLTALVASRLGADSDPLRPLRWSASGACVEIDDGEPLLPGSTGALRVQPADWLPEPLLLPATVADCERTADGRRVWLRFGPLTAALESALSRHLFRIHRRAIAESRRGR